MPNPKGSGLPNPASYTDLGNGAVLDNLTCLAWEMAPLATLDTLANNTARCASLASERFAGYDDWRLPTRVEMASLVDFTKTSGDAIDAIFPTEPHGYYRTGSDWYETITKQNTSGYAWIYNMGSGLTSNAYAGTSNAYVRCVRGNGTGEAIDAFAVEPPNHYAIANGEVTDNYTGLVWQQMFSSATMPWSSAASTCSSLKLNGRVWRVPSLNELASIVDEALVGPAVNRTAFPATAYCGSGNWYWASASYVGNPSDAWGINYCDGFTGYNSGASGAWNYFPSAYVRCVR
jgi:hypothetical protein